MNNKIKKWSESDHFSDFFQWLLRMFYYQFCSKNWKHWSNLDHFLLYSSVDSCAIKRLNWMSRFQTPNYLKNLALKLGKMTRRLLNWYDSQSFIPRVISWNSISVSSKFTHNKNMMTTQNFKSIVCVISSYSDMTLIGRTELPRPSY